MKHLSEILLKSAIAAVLKADKFEIVSAESAEDGTAIRFEAKSKSGQVRVRGIFCDPQGELDLEDPPANVEAEGVAGEEPAANEDEDDDEKSPH